MACVFLAAKAEDYPREIWHVMEVHYDQFRRRRGLKPQALTLGGRVREAAAQIAKILVPQHCSRPSQLYNHWKELIVEYEAEVLRQCGFKLHPLQQHPIDLLPPLVALLTSGVDGLQPSFASALQTQATALLNDMGRLDVCVRYLPETIAVAAVAIAAMCVSSRPLAPPPRAYLSLTRLPSQRPRL